MGLLKDSDCKPSLKRKTVSEERLLRPESSEESHPTVFTTGCLLFLVAFYSCYLQRVAKVTEGGCTGTGNEWD